MQIENQNCAYLLALLRCALTGASAPAVPEGLDFDAFFDLARRQQVYNIVFPLLAALPASATAGYPVCRRERKSAGRTTPTRS